MKTLADNLKQAIETDRSITSLRNEIRLSKQNLGRSFIAILTKEGKSKLSIHVRSQQFSCKQRTIENLASEILKPRVRFGIGKLRRFSIVGSFDETSCKKVVQWGFKFYSKVLNFGSKLHRHSDLLYFHPKLV